MYTTTFDKLFDSVWNEPLIRDAVLDERRNTTFRSFDVETLKDGKQKVTINTIGHNPKDITVDVTEEELKITAKKVEGTSRFVRDIDLTLSVGKDFDGTKSEAKFENGLLALTIDRKASKKAKSLKISY
jgi:HSP20 family molecular chaperone IbpA|tara:strand:+ start:778 stop:1164 length:387 start_codon:yes stop_codon:yes gene_type:complete